MRATPARSTVSMLALAAALGGLGCTDEPVAVDRLDVGFYECEVQPIFDRGCSFPGCHGNDARPLRIYSMSKTRLAGPYSIGDVLTDKELCANFYRVAAFAAPDGRSQLITKPATLDGQYSQYHEGNYLFGPTDVEARCLELWMDGAKHEVLDEAPPPSDCELPWRRLADGTYPTCAPRAVDCQAALEGPDIPEDPAPGEEGA